MHTLNPSLPYLHICHDCTHCAHGLLGVVLMDTSDQLCVVIMIWDEFHPYCETNEVTVVVLFKGQLRSCSQL